MSKLNCFAVFDGFTLWIIANPNIDYSITFNQNSDREFVIDDPLNKIFDNFLNSHIARVLKYIAVRMPRVSFKTYSVIVIVQLNNSNCSPSVWEGACVEC